jgi:nucleotide-binding universal stress UspA family protein
VTDARPIVVPLDGSKNAETALPIAAKLAAIYGATIQCVYVVDKDEVAQAGELDRARQVFASYVEGLAGSHGLGDVRLTATVVEGSPARGVLDVASSARMVVLGSHGRSGLQSALIGSVADKIVRGATVPTLVVPMGGPQALDSKPILVALDGSREAEAGLELARELAAALGAQVALVRAYSVPPPAGIEFVAYPVDLVTTLQEGAEEYVAKTAREGERSFVVLGSPVDAIQQVADQLDAGLVVMTSHGKGFAQRVALGSSTDRAMHTLKRPLLVVPVAAAR